MPRDEMTRLEDARPRITTATQAARSAAKARLLTSIESEQRRPRFRLRLPQIDELIPAVGVLVTLAIVAFVLVAVQPGHRSPQSGSSGTGSSARGSILASGGQTLAGSRSRLYLTVHPAGLPGSSADRDAEAELAVGLVYGSTAASAQPLCSPTSVSGASQLACRIEMTQPSTGENAQTSGARFSSNDPALISVTAAHALRTHSPQLPGLTVTTVTARDYPNGMAAAQVLGVTATAPTGAPSGETGLESEYNRQLAAGRTLKTSIDLALQKVGERSLRTSIAHEPNGADAGGAFVAMNPQNGQVLAMGSAPSNGTDDQAVTSAAPLGSTVKPITAIAALESGDWSVDDTFDDTGRFCPSPGHPATCLSNSGRAAYGVLNVAQALKVSDDVFFYHLGYVLNANPATHPNGGELQQWARGFGIGQPTGIDLPDAADGVLPTPRNVKRGWTVGDNVNLAVGQGGVRVTPLQVAVVYSALANGGTVITPHIATAVEDPDGTVQRQNAPGTRRRLKIAPANLKTVLAGLRAAAVSGTASDVMGSLRERVYAKTGTSEIVTNGVATDDAWFAAFVPAAATQRPIVVVVWIPGGGFGGVAAAPVARQILSQWFTGTPGPYTPGASDDQ